jgi:simple sugar transport system permease protein
VAVVLMALVALVLYVLTERTRIGRLLYATGGNEVATRLAGASTTRLKTLAYVISGTLASLGGIIVAARVGRGDVSSGGSLLMDAVAASLIGFTVMGLRRPNVLGTIVGAVFVGVSAQRPDDAECPLLHPGFRQGRRAGWRACPDLRPRPQQSMNDKQ